MEERISMMATLELRTAAPFNRLFPIKECVLNEIVSDMKEHGYDYAHPIIVWAGHKVTVIDGHTRLKAALQLGMSKVPIALKEFADEDNALQYAIRAQSNRRNLSDAELLTCLNELDKRKTRGGNPKASRESIGKSAAKTADILGISRAKVERLRTVHDHAPDQIKNAVNSGKMSVNKAYKATMEARKAEEAASEKPSEETLAQLKTERKEAIVKSIVGAVNARLEREIQEYPEIRYALSERNEIQERIASEITNLIGTMLPGETEEEQ